MKVKITLLVTSQDSKFNVLDPRRVKVLLDEAFCPPHKYLSTKNEDETLEELCESYLNFHYNWLVKSLVGFRKVDDTEVEVIYFSSIPNMDGCNKDGVFYSVKEIEKNKRMEEYYEQFISKFGGSRRS